MWFKGVWALRAMLETERLRYQSQRCRSEGDASLRRRKGRGEGEYYEIASRKRMLGDLIVEPSGRDRGENTAAVQRSEEDFDRISLHGRTPRRWVICFQREPFTIDREVCSAVQSAITAATSVNHAWADVSDLSIARPSSALLSRSFTARAPPCLSCGREYVVSSGTCEMCLDSGSSSEFE